MHHDIEVHATPEAVAAAAALHVAEWARVAIARQGTFTFAVSGGSTPWAMFARLAELDFPWDMTTIFQVDERVATIDDPDRNLARLRASLDGRAAGVKAMPVEEADLDAAAATYATQLPERFDLVHLGLGSDGHTASLVPGDEVLAITDRLVALTVGEYQGRRRMTLTYAALGRANQLLWLVAGADKHDALRRLLAGDRTIPAARVTAAASLILADNAAAGA